MDKTNNTVNAVVAKHETMMEIHTRREERFLGIIQHPWIFDQQE